MLCKYNNPVQVFGKVFGVDSVMSPVDTERLADFLRKLCLTERIGGRVRIVDEWTVELSDVGTWPHGAIDFVQHSGFPGVAAHVRACRRSLTGFVVVFTWKQGVREELGWYVAIACVLGVCVYVLSGFPWRSAYSWILPI
jgi:hypothetical protein